MADTIEASSESSSDEYVDSMTAITSPDSTEGSNLNVIRSERKPPLPGHVYKIVSADCGRQIMILQGQVVLANPEELGSPYWVCEQYDSDWLGFRNPATGKLLGHDSGNPGLIRCDVQNHQQWEQLLAIPHTRTEGAFSILTEYWYGRRAIGSCEVDGKTRLCRIKDEHDPGIAWTFSEV